MAVVLVIRGLVFPGAAVVATLVVEIVAVVIDVLGVVPLVATLAVWLLWHCWCPCCCYCCHWWCRSSCCILDVVEFALLLSLFMFVLLLVSFFLLLSYLLLPAFVVLAAVRAVGAACSCYNIVRHVAYDNVCIRVDDCVCLLFEPTLAHV